MGLIEFHEGCGNFKGCFGPEEPYLTIFGTELWHLIPHLLISMLIGFILLSIFYYLNKKGKINWPQYVLIILPIIITVLTFFLLAYFFPVHVLY